jgi:predicted CoA-binding protein
MSDQIDQSLALKTWAVVGLSNNSERAAYGVAKLLIEKGHTVIPVHPKAESVHGQKGYAKLSDIPVSIDVVDIFVNSDLAGNVVDEAITIGAKGVWLQLDVINAAAVSRAKDAGLLTVMNRCPAIEYKKRV